MTTDETTIERTDDQTTGPAPLELLVDGTRRTAVPVGAAAEERLTRWITVEREDLRDLEAWR